MGLSNRTVFVVAGLGVTMAAAFAVYVAAVHLPTKRAAAVETEIRIWSELWKQTRTCLVGPQTIPGNGRDALAQRQEVSGALSESLAGCLEGLSKLERPGGASTGIPKVEAQWATLRHRLASLADALRTDEDRDPQAPSVGQALQAVDQAYAGLRAAAWLLPDEPPGPPLQPLPVTFELTTDAAGPHDRPSRQ